MIIPALDEAGALPETLAALGGQDPEGPFEVILADGGSSDGTVDLFRSAAREWADRGFRGLDLVAPVRGRAAQMNAGGRLASGDVLVFLHADTILTPGALAAVRRALRDPRVVGGGFRHRFREPGLLLRLISAWATLRSVALKIHYGDQAMFARSVTFRALGGFPEVALFEDLRLARALRRAGRVVTLRPAAETSARRLLRGGVLRTACRFAWLRLRHAWGVDPDPLRRGYPDVR